MRAVIGPNTAVALGAACGSVLRYLCSLATLAMTGPGYPSGTLVVNVVGSFLIGIYAAASGPGERFNPGPNGRLFVMTGFCGGFTTFSLFSLETILMLEDRQLMAAAGHVLVSVALWLAAAWTGHATGLSWNRRPGRS